MTTGASGTFAVNGTNLLLIPSSHGWTERDEMGIDGGSHPVYTAYRNYEMKWELMSTAELKQIIDAYNIVSNTGTLSWDLPEWGNSNYVFKTYSGTTAREPEIGKYFVGWVEDVTLLIMKVRTS